MSWLSSQSMTSNEEFPIVDERNGLFLGCPLTRFLQIPRLPSHRVAQHPEAPNPPLSLRATLAMVGLKVQLPASLLLLSPLWLQLLWPGGKNIRYVKCSAPKPCLAQRLTLLQVLYVITCGLFGDRHSDRRTGTPFQPRQGFNLHNVNPWHSQPPPPPPPNHFTLNINNSNQQLRNGMYQNGQANHGPIYY